MLTVQSPSLTVVSTPASPPPVKERHVSAEGLRVGDRVFLPQASEVDGIVVGVSGELGLRYFRSLTPPGADSTMRFSVMTSVVEELEGRHFTVQVDSIQEDFTAPAEGRNRLEEVHVLLQSEPLLIERLRKMQIKPEDVFDLRYILRV